MSRVELGFRRSASAVGPQGPRPARGPRRCRSHPSRAQARRPADWHGHARHAPARRASWPCLVRPKVYWDGSRFEWAYLHEGASGPRLDHIQRLVEVGDFDLGVATDHLLAFDEWAVGD